MEQVFYLNQFNINNVGAGYDIAILKLKTQSVEPTITLPTAAPVVGSQVTSIGYGVSETAQYGLSNDVLRYTTLQVGSGSPCPSMAAGVVCDRELPSPLAYNV